MTLEALDHNASITEAEFNVMLSLRKYFFAFRKVRLVSEWRSRRSF